MVSNTQLGAIGETAVMLELLKMGFDVININNSYNNYRKADLICMSPNNEKSVKIQVKTGTTNNILTGFVSELDGTIPKIEENIIGPWVFVKIDKDNLSKYEFYILTKEEVLTLITTSNKWYVTYWNRKLKSKPIVGINVNWLEGEGEEESKTHLTKKHKKYINPLGHNSKDNWEKIINLLL